MSYSTPAMVRQALVPSISGEAPPDPLSHTAADLSNSQLSDAITEADSTIDSYIGRFYAVPVAAVGSTPVESATPHPVDYWSRNIAAYNATLSFRGSQDFTDTDPIARRYTATMDALKGVSTGKIRLNLPAEGKDSGGGAYPGASPAVNPYYGELFTPDDFDLSVGWAETGYLPFWRS